MSTRKTKVVARRVPEADSRITEALAKIDGGVLYLLAEQTDTPTTLTQRHNLAVVAKAAMDLRSILTLGGTF